ncbi:MAG: ABC transporter transmembrane domain-containing protein, partial [Elusimicrobiota bacterium]
MNVINRLLPYLKPYRGRFFQASAAMVFVALSNGAVAFLVKPIIDGIFIYKDNSALWLVTLSVPLLFALKSITSYVQNYLMSWIGQRGAQQLREDLFTHLHTLSLEFYGDKKSGEILARATNDLTLVQSMLQFVPLYLIRDFLTVIVLVSVLFYQNWKFAIVALGIIPMVAILIVILGRKMRDASAKSQAIMGDIYQRFQESLQGMLIIKAYNYEKGAIKKFRVENQAFFNQMMRYLRATALSGPLMEFLGSLIIAALIYFGGREILLGRMTPGEFSAFLTAFFLAYAPVKNLGKLNSELQRGLASADRIFQILEERPTIVDKP